MNYLLLAIMVAGGLSAPGGKENQVEYRELSPEEERVIEHKGTERPFSGKYNDHFEPGTYQCRRCGAELYRSGDKFKSGCGWPSFDDQIQGAVRREMDADGRRTEILCARCGGHLGHVFTGERLTEKNTRHCVNSLSLDFTPAAVPESPRKAYFAGGCFWGIEASFAEVPGVLEAVSGYMGGHVERPTYEQVCSGRTGHAETVQVVYDPAQVDYESLAKLFFEIHDPSQRNRQGPDRGTQYRSAVFFTNETERAVIDGLIDRLRAGGLDVVTEVSEAEKFWPAEDYHQDYFRRTGRAACGSRRVNRFR